MKKDVLKIIISFVLLLISTFIKFDYSWINYALYIVSYLIVGLEILIKALVNIFKGKVFDENFLMSVATLGAIAINELPEAVSVMLFYQIGEFFQDLAVDKSRKSITELMDIRPDYANLYVDNEIKKVNPNEVRINDIIVVKPGEKIPLDGTIIEGTSSIDTKAITGEPMPVDAEKGNSVYSGCINLNGLIKIQVKKEFAKSTVSKILDLVENANSKKTKSENFVTKFAKYYTPIVVLLAIVIAIFIPLLTSQSFNDALYIALSFLVVSCPCALVVSIPLSFFSAIGGASQMGILIKGSNYIEALSKVDTMVFDKTGTLTKGTFNVQKIVTRDINEDKLLKYAAHAEYFSTHPLAIAIKKAYTGQIEKSKIKKVKELSGYGIEAQIDNVTILIGNEKLLIDHNIDALNHDELGTIVYVCIDKKCQGYLVIADEIKADAKLMIDELKNNSVEKIVMLTGDKEDASKDIAKSLNIDEVYANLLPQDKVKIVDELLQNKKDNKLAFVGDGINDAPVLARADIGIAMGALGADSAIEAADIVIMTDELKKINNAIKLSTKTMKIVRENIILAIAIKVIVLLLTLIGISTMWEAVFADVGVTLIAVLNSLRTLQTNKKLQIN